MVFQDLRAESALLVSAARNGGRTRRVRIKIPPANRHPPFPVPRPSPSAATVSGTGHYVGSYYTYSNPTAALATTTAATSATYRGKALTSGGVNYLYWDVPDSLYCQNGQYGQTRGCVTCALGTDIPIGYFSAGACGATTGGRWDANMVPFMDTTDTLPASQNMALNIMARMDKARFGGLAAAGGTPIGCTLWNNYRERTHFPAAMPSTTRIGIDPSWPTWVPATGCCTPSSPRT